MSFLNNFIKKEVMNTIIQTPTTNIEDSLNFYSKLNFSTIAHENLALVTDGNVVIQINPDRFARAGIKLSATSWKETVDRIGRLTSVIKTDEGYLLSDASGTWIYLVENEKMVNPELTGIEPSVLGNFAGISLEVISIANALELWKILDFSISMNTLDQDWISMTNKDGMTLSLMKPLICPHLFFNPSLTYFNGKNNLTQLEQIQK